MDNWQKLLYFVYADPALNIQNEDYLGAGPYDSSRHLELAGTLEFDETAFNRYGVH